MYKGFGGRRVNLLLAQSFSAALKTSNKNLEIMVDAVDDFKI